VADRAAAALVCATRRVVVVTMTSCGPRIDGIQVRLSALADDVLAKAGLVELPFDYDNDTWVLAKDSMRFLIALIRRIAPDNVIEFGSGVSTRVVAHVLRKGSVVRSFDHVEAYAERTRSALAAAADGSDVEVLHRAIGLGFFNGKVLPFYRLGRQDLGPVREADLVIVDGPPGSWGREAALYASFPVMRQGALLLLDDAARPGEQKAVAAWQRFFGEAMDFHFLPALGKGMLIARKTGASALGRAFTWSEKFDSVRHSSRALWRHRPWRRRLGGQDHGC
jgi:predicted O-methyltransferase YrrM